MRKFASCNEVDTDSSRAVGHSNEFVAVMRTADAVALGSGRAHSYPRHTAGARMIGPIFEKQDRSLGRYCGKVKAVHSSAGSNTMAFAILHVQY